MTQQFQLCHSPLNEPELLTSHSFPLASGEGTTGFHCVAFQELGMRGTRRCLGIGIPTLSTTRTPIIPGSSWPAQSSQARNDANPCKSQLWLKLSRGKNRGGQKPSWASNLALRCKHFQRRRRERRGVAGGEGYMF